jgi:hypothetical protein
MHVKSRLALAGATAVLALALNPAAALASSDNGETLIKADLIGSTSPKNGGQAIFEVAPGGRDWIVARGEVRVRASGRIDVRLDGLQIPAADNPTGVTSNPVPAITATLYCGGSPAAVSTLQPLTVPDGDARFRETLATVPADCQMATVLINPNGAAGTYIASSVPDDD